MRLRGVVKISILLIIDFVFLYHMVGIAAALLIISGIILYAWLGEYTALMKDRAVESSCLNDYEQMQLARAKEELGRKIERVSGHNYNISKVKLFVIPSEQVNAYAYGLHNIGITRGLLNQGGCCSLEAVLGHEISHIFCMDAVFQRIIFATVTLIIIGLMLASFVTVSFMWIIFLVLCLVGICGGFCSIFLFSGLSMCIKEVYKLIQYLLIFIYKSIVGIISRQCEFRADKYVVDLGYGSLLLAFLDTYVVGQEIKQKTISEILYDSHPNAYRRIERIRQYEKIKKAVQKI